jgi:mono/diheme cytochrome c family protein
MRCFDRRTAAVLGVMALAGAGDPGVLRGAQEAPAASPGTSRSVRDGVYTAAQAQRGEVVYREKCLECHGSALTGVDEAAPLAGPRFSANWNAKTVGDLFERIRLTMPPGSATRLPSQENADVIAYILSYNKFPAGDTELPRQSAPLKQIAVAFENR